MESIKFLKKSDVRIYMYLDLLLMEWTRDE
ncbi:hypothetical protein CLSAP_18940 [Clostridium saccharoperbutylacetonicum]|jgi:hypothetical protein|nr:hypothetical protein CLSAP_18940 [Clostridium saccharoperbutylacetonicum]NSB30419.1 hypothetical protein [Clostridium saccharoperbutylacetonicum]